MEPSDFTWYERFIFTRNHYLRLLKGDATRLVIGILDLIQRPLSLEGAQRAGAFLGRNVFRPLARKARRTTLKNLDHAFGDTLPPSEKACIARDVFHNLGRVFLETLRFRREGADLLERLVPDLSPLAPVKASLATGKGAMVLTPHMGNIDLMPGILARQGIPTGLIMSRVRHPRLHRMVVEMRSLAGVKVLFQQEGTAPVVAMLKVGHVVGVAPDQDIDRVAGLFVDFFGRPALTPAGPVSLALLGEVPIFLIFMTWTRGAYRLTLEGPLDFDRSGRPTAVVRAGTEAWSRAFEAAIRRSPGAWWWFHPRWKTTPESLAAKNERRRQRRERK